jgi:RNA polymerase sigma-70 factor (ECF subfamily)
MPNSSVHAGFVRTFHGPASEPDDAVTSELADLRPELLAHCYRMLGSLADAEEQVQETMLRAWRSREDYRPELGSVRSWAYRIATNCCLTSLAGRARRPLPSGIGPASDDPFAPLTRDMEVPWLQPFPGSTSGLTTDPAARVAGRDAIRLAFVAALQLLPARQRAVLILRDVLAFSAAEVAALIETSVAAVNSALQRARQTLKAGAPQQETMDGGDVERSVVDAYLTAFERADVAGLTKLLADQAILEMPPVPLWYRGREDYAAFMRRVFDLRGTRWRTERLVVNGQPAFLAHALDPSGRFQPHTLQVLTVSGGRITRNVVFADPQVLAALHPESGGPAGSWSSKRVGGAGV